MIKINKEENDYIEIEVYDNKWIIDSMVLWLSPKELEQLFKKVGKILSKGKDYCVMCKASLK